MDELAGRLVPVNMLDKEHDDIRKTTIATITVKNATHVLNANTCSATCTRD